MAKRMKKKGRKQSGHGIEGLERLYGKSHRGSKKGRKSMRKKERE